MNIYSQTVLLEAWTEPHRAYHSLGNHLLPMLKAITFKVHNPRDLNLLGKMAWWHDAVYVVGAKDNEVNSVQLIRDTLNDESTDYRVDRGIMATVDHRPTNDPLIDYFLRLDLGPICTGDIRGLERNEELIWQEFKAKYDVPEYVAGRLDFLHKIAEHPFADRDGILWLIAHVERKYSHSIAADIDVRR